MKRLLTITLTLLFATLMLAACGGDSSSQAPASIPPAQASSSAASVAEPATSEPAASPYDVNALLAALIPAAGMDSTIEMSELELKAGGITTDNVESFAGAESPTYDDGGIVLVIQAKPGQAAAVKAELEAMKDLRADDRYAEFAVRLANTKDARIVENGDYLIFAVSAKGQDGGWDALDTAIAAAFQ